MKSQAPFCTGASYSLLIPDILPILQFPHSLALSIKMNILLYLPGIALILIKQLGLVQTLLHLFNMLLMHLIIAYPFLFSHPRSYFAGAFNISRQFLYKWTVNWRFVPEDIFLSKSFAYGLLLCHLTLLAAFALRRWMTSDGGPMKVLLRAILRPFIPAAFVLPSGDGTALRVH